MKEKRSSFSLSNLIGIWDMRRHYSNGYSMTGRLIFKACSADLFEYREEGVMTAPNGHQGECWRTYIFQQNDAGFSVYFDGERARLFHHVSLRAQAHDPKSLMGQASHQCLQDHYETRYTFERIPVERFSIEHNVSGPKKNWRIQTDYRRLETLHER